MLQSGVLFLSSLIFDDVDGEKKQDMKNSSIT
jgi:hypothetical protein